MAQEKKRYSIRDNKLKASKALRYEWWMLNECKDKIQLYKNKDKIMHNALIEAFCVHLRNFIEFFYRKQKKGKRPFYTDYLPSNKTIPLKHKLDKYEDKVNNLLSHLTYKRLNYTKNKKEWNIPQIAIEVNENMFQFIDASDKNLLCDEIKEYLKQLMSENKTQGNSYISTTSDVILPGKLISARH